MSYDVLVIGGGVNGLTTAAYLARAGKKVLVAERRATLGGLCVTEEFHPGFRANSCVDDPGWVPAPVMKDLGLAAHGYVPTLAPHSMTIPIDGGAPIIITPDVRATTGSIAAHSIRDANRWPEFCAFVAQLCGFVEAIYSVRAPAVESNAPTDLLALLSLGKKLRGLGRRGMIDVIRTIPMPIADLLDEWFEHEGLKGALSTLGVSNVQHGPQSGGTALVFLHNHVGMPVGAIGGRRVVRGGVGALVDALAKAVTRAGGEIRTNADVSRVRVREDRVTGVALASGEEIDVATVVSSADPRRTFTSLLDAGDLDPEFLHAIDCVRMRGPQVRVHLALSALPMGAVASMVVAPTMSYVEQAYDAAKHGRIAERPWLRMSVPTMDDASFGSDGKHVMTIHAQYAPYRLREGWTVERRVALGESIVRLASDVVPGLGGLVLHSDVLTSPCVEERYGATEGSLLHGELTLDQFLFARPVASMSRYASPVEGLWLCGSGTHPGAGTAGASGRLAAKEILG
ncbi:MAG: NAD(P)/FAD-dependent oxidoreductase [Gemmatimonadaceae bacterium]